MKSAYITPGFPGLKGYIMAENNTATIGFEKQIWEAADVLRGNMDASEYKQVVLGLIFLKYISDRFESKYTALKAGAEGAEEDRDEYITEGIFFVPPDARWGVIAAGAHTPEIGMLIDQAMRSIENENKRLKGILPKNFARQELDVQVRGDLEHFLRQGAREHRAEAGQGALVIGHKLRERGHLVYLRGEVDLREQRTDLFLAHAAVQQGLDLGQHTQP